MAEHVDIELTSLNRLENIVATLLHTLREERQRSVVTLIVTLLPKEPILPEETPIRSKLVISHIRVHSKHEVDTAAIVAASKAKLKPLEESSASSSSNQLDSSILDEIKILETDMAARIRSMASGEHSWLHDRTVKFSRYKQRKRGDRERSPDNAARDTPSVSSDATTFDNAIDRLRIMPRFHDDTTVSNLEAPSALKLGIFLFFQWMCLLTSTHEDCPIDAVHFEWLPHDGVVRVHLTEPTSIIVPSLMRQSGPHQQQSGNRANDIDNGRVDVGSASRGVTILAGDDDRGVWDALAFASYNQPLNFTFYDGYEYVHEETRAKNQIVRLINGRDDERKSFSRVHCLTVLDSSDTTTNIGTTATSSSRSKALKRQRTKRIVNDGANVDDKNTGNDNDATATVGDNAKTIEPKITREQRRIVETLERIWRYGERTTNNSDRGADSGRITGCRVVVDGVAGSGKTFLLGLMLRRFPRVLYLVKKRNFIDATAKRFQEFGSKLRTQTIDAYLMSLMNIRVLQTWLSLRQSSLHVLKDRLRRIMNHRSSRSSLGMCCFASSPNAPNASQQELVFVDEFSLIESSLADLLNVALRDSVVLLVGDCNQQPAIGEREDQAVRTMLGYEHVCFMYENVRARDNALLRRLSCFTARSGGGTDSTDGSGGYGSSDTSCLTALNGLPRQSTVDMRAFLRSTRCIGYDTVLADYNALPRLIVASNERVNYANWAIGYLLWRNCPICHGVSGENEIASAADRIANRLAKWNATNSLSRRKRRREERSSTADRGECSQPLCCLRYKRSVLVTAKRKYAPKRRYAEDGLCETVIDSSASFRLNETAEDDAYADEHFVLVGMRYRMIHSRANWPMQVGSRVIVRTIESRDTVVIETDDDKRIRCRLRMTHVKPYEYSSKWQTRVDAIDTDREYWLYMFPFVMDAATTVYQVQGVTFDEDTYRRCYIDVYGMNDKALYVTLSRFQSENQIHGVINCNHLCH